ncbi:hypothetical protein Vi05172_g1462 [Venturia inaequalis]|nr:hypothetical protein Vi05172_g1462 [Venturia inaequalis]
MSHHNHDMDEEMEEEGGQMTNARLVHSTVPREKLEIYVSEDDGVNLARYNAYLMVVAEGPDGQSTTMNVLEHTGNESAASCSSPAQALYRLFILTAIKVNINLLRDYPNP